MAPTCTRLHTYILGIETVSGPKTEIQVSVKQLYLLEPSRSTSRIIYACQQEYTHIIEWIRSQLTPVNGECGKEL